MPAEIGHGAASYTNVVTKSGANQVHGSLFEFVRNAAFDARNYFDYKDPTGKRRIPPFVRNEFGFTNGGPIVIPGIYNGRNRTFYFGEYQGFRQVLGTTQVMPVPTAAERQGIDTTTFPGDTLTVPVNADSYASARWVSAAERAKRSVWRSHICDVVEGCRRAPTSSRCAVDHQISDKASLLTRFSLNQVTGPLTNPDQTAINPSFGVQFFDHQRNAGVKYTRTISSASHFGNFAGIHSQHAVFSDRRTIRSRGLAFADGLFQAFNLPAGSIFGSYSNLYQFKQDMAWVRGSHAFKWGAEIRVNRDSTIFGTNPNGIYRFGGGTAYSPVLITSASGTHDIQPGDPLPDSLTGLLTATPYSYNITAAASITPVGEQVR